MLKLEQIQKNAAISGLEPGQVVRIATTEPVGDNSLTVYYKTADGKLYALAPAATDGTETAVRVLATDTDATLIDRDDAIAVARHAIVARNALIWPAGITAPQKAAAEAQLVAIGILVRDAA